MPATSTTRARRGSRCRARSPRRHSQSPRPSRCARDPRHGEAPTRRATGVATERPASSTAPRRDHDQHVRPRGRVPPARAAGRAESRGRSESRPARDQHVEIPRQLEMLKPIVEDVHGGAELLLGEHAGQVTIRRDADDGAGHLRAPASAARRPTGRARPNAVAVRHDHHAGSASRRA